MAVVERKIKFYDRRATPDLGMEVMVWLEVRSWVMSTTGRNWVLFVDVPETWLTHRYVSPPVLPVIPRVGIAMDPREPKREEQKYWEVV